MTAEAEISNLSFRMDMLEQRFKDAAAENSALKKQHEEDQETILKLQQENRNLHESVDYLTKKLYGRSSEKTSVLKGQIPGQLSLFDEAEAEADPNQKEPDLKQKVKSYIRKKYDGQRKDALKSIKHIKRIADLSPNDRFCEVCGAELKPVGEKFVRTELQFIPAKIYAIDCYQKTYDKGIDYCNQVLNTERALQNLSPEARKKKRDELERPVLVEFFDWVEDKRCITFMGDKLRTALNYAHNHKQEFMNYLEDGNCACHNQICENAIRPFTIGRKNWLFSGGPRGAEASAGYYSIVETAKANGLRPEKYLTELLSDIPGMDFGNHPEYFDDMMP